MNAIFYGSGWNNDPTGQAFAAEHAQQFAADIVNSPYMDMLGNACYGIGRGSSSWENIWDNLDHTLPDRRQPAHHLAGLD